MVTVNIGIQDMLINGQVAEVARFEVMKSMAKKRLSEVSGSFIRKESNIV